MQKSLEVVVGPKEEASETISELEEGRRENLSACRNRRLIAKQALDAFEVEGGR
jgi:hypothetical protein